MVGVVGVAGVVGGVGAVGVVGGGEGTGRMLGLAGANTRRYDTQP